MRNLESVIALLFMYVLSGAWLCAQNIPCLLPPYYVDQPGSYALCGTVNQAITIDADNVCLDLNGYGIDMRFTVSENALLIMPGRHNICIMNGFIKGDNSIDYGIHALGDNQHQITTVCFHKLCVQGCKQVGILADYCSDLTVENCSLIGNNCGFQGIAITNSCLGNCTIIGGTSGCLLNGCSYNTINNCSVRGLRGSSSAIGFYSASGVGNTVTQCTIEDIQAPDSYGVLLVGPEIDDTISRNLVHTIVSTSSGGTACGIDMVWSQTVSSQQDVGVDCLSWSPDGHYLAVGGTVPNASNKRIAIFACNNGSLEYVSTCSVTYENDSGSMVNAYHIAGVSWSPDGQYLVAAGNGTTSDFTFYTNVYSFSSSQMLSLVAHNTNFNYAIGRAVDWIVGSSQYIISAGDYAQGIGAHQWLYQIFTFDGTGFTKIVKDFVSYHGDTVDGSIYTVKSSSVYNVQQNQSCPVIAFGGIIIAKALYRAGVQVTQFVDGDLNFDSSDQDLFWNSDVKAQVDQVCWSNGSQMLACVGLASGDESHGGIHIDRVSYDDYWVPTLHNVFDEQAIGNEVTTASWLPIYRLAYGVNDSGSEAAVHIGEFGLDYGQLAIDQLPSNLGMGTLQSNAVSWSPDYAYLAYGLSGGLGLFVMPSQCSIKNNVVTGVTGPAGAGIYDTSGSTIIINNYAYHNNTNYNANNNTNVAAGTNTAINLPANVDFN